MKKKILIILPDLRIGGAEKNSVLIANELSDKNFEIIFVIKNNINEYGSLLNKNIKIYKLQVDKLRSIIFPLKSIILKEKPLLIISSMWPLTSLTFISLLLARVKSNLYFVEHVPLFTSRKYETNSSKFFMKLLINLTYHFAKKIICVSEGVKNEILRETNINKNKFEVIYNPISIINSSKIINKNDWKIKTSKKLLTVGSLKYAKNHELLIKTFSILNLKINCELIIIGQGELYQDLKKLITKLNLNSRIQIINYQNNISYFYNTADLFILTSRWEGFGNVIVESFIYGTPVVSLDCPYGPSEIITENFLGKLVFNDDPIKIADSILDTLAKPVLKNKIIDYSKKYDASIQVNKYLKVFNVN